ncbi:hypothetical protein GmHk_17G048368 [Glycine max]|nr:hypothetical protein GmHk_17G048368 [Glycine max]
MVKTRSLGQALDRIIERALGRKVKGDVDEPTTFARKQRKIAHVAGNVEHVDHSYDEIHEQPKEATTDDVVTDVEGFLGGSHDISILMDYIYHVTVKLSSHERKVEKFDRFVPEIEGLLTVIGLSPLIAYSFDTDDRRLISVFAERWHKETSSFHLLIGNVTITLDDVTSLLHLLITRAFQSFELVQKKYELRQYNVMGHMLDYPVCETYIGANVMQHSEL